MTPTALCLTFVASALVACSPAPVADAGPDARAPDAPDVALDSARPDAAALDAALDAAGDAALDAAGDAAGGDVPAVPDASPPDAPPPAAAFPVADPPAGFDGLTVTGPLVIDGASGRTVTGVSVRNPDGPCVVIRGGADVVIERSNIGPCAGDGVSVSGDARRVTVRDSYVHDTVDNGVSSYQAHDLTVSGNHFARTRSAGYFHLSDGVRFERNASLNVQGGMARGQLVQFNHVTGPGSVVRCNVSENRPGESNPEDAINMFDSSGEPGSPILIEGNRVLGGGPSPSGGGILLGDGGGSYQIARDNTVVDPGQYGVAAAGGAHVTIVGNRVFARSQPFTNVGIYVWNQYSPPCNTVSVRDNRVRWTNAAGADNPFWNNGNCGPLDEGGNDWGAPLTTDSIQDVPAPCRP